MSAVLTSITRLMIALALIVQIYAPVGSSLAMVSQATDPLWGLALCEHDEDGEASGVPHDPGPARHGDACAFCVLVGGAGYAPPALPPATPVPSDHATTVAEWRPAIATVVAVRLLDHIRGRAPPALS